MFVFAFTIIKCIRLIKEFCLCLIKKKKKWLSVCHIY